MSVVSEYFCILHLRFDHKNEECLDKLNIEEALQGPVVQKPINTNPRLKINQGLFLYSQMLFSTDIRPNFTLEEVNLEKQK